MDFSVKFNGITADLLPDASLKYVMNSPAFSNSVLVGDFSYSISFPNTDINRKIFKFIERIDIAEETTQMECQLFLYDNFFVDCIFQVNKSSKYAVQGNLINSAYDIINKIKGKTTKDLTNLYMENFPTYDDRVDYLKDSINHNQDSRPFVIFPVYNNHQLTDKITNDDGTTFEIPFGYYVNEMQNDAGNMVFVGPNYVAFPYIGYIIDKIFEYFNFKVEDNKFKSGELAQLVLLNFIKSTASVFNIDSESLFDISPGYFSLINHIVKVDIEKLLENLNKVFCHAFFSDRINNTFQSVLLKDLLVADYIDWTEKIVAIEDKEFGHDSSDYYFHFDFSDDALSNGQKPIEEKDIQPNYTVDNFDELPDTASTNEIAYVTELDTFFYWGKKSNDSQDTSAPRWHNYSYNFFGKKIVSDDKDENEIGTNLSPVPLENITEQKTDGILKRVPYNLMDTNNYLREWALPYTDQQIVNTFFPADFVKIDPRLCFYRGLATGRQTINTAWNNFSYPFGTPGNKDPQGNKIGDIQLKWDGDEGLYNTFWKDWIEILAKQSTIIFKIKLTTIDILNIDLKKRIKIGSNFYLIKKLTMDLPLINPVKVEMVRI